MHKVEFTDDEINNLIIFLGRMVSEGMLEGIVEAAGIVQIAKRLNEPAIKKMKKGRENKEKKEKVKSKK